MSPYQISHSNWSFHYIQTNCQTYGGVPLAMIDAMKYRYETLRFRGGEPWKYQTIWVLYDILSLMSCCVIQSADLSLHDSTITTLFIMCYHELAYVMGVLRRKLLTTEFIQNCIITMISLFGNSIVIFHLFRHPPTFLKVIYLFLSFIIVVYTERVSQSYKINDRDLRSLPYCSIPYVAEVIISYRSSGVIMCSCAHRLLGCLERFKR